MQIEDLLGAPPPISAAPRWQDTVNPADADYLMASVPQSGAAVQDLVSDDPITSRGLEPISHKGLFGMKGTLRDVLGVVGDALSGNTNYANRRRQERFSDILAGKYIDNAEENFLNDPALVMQRLAEGGFGEEAAALQTQMLARQKAAREMASAQRLDASREAATDDKVFGNIRSSLAGLAAIPDPDQRALAYQRRKQYIDAYVSKMGSEGLAALVRDALPPDYVDGIENLFIDPQQMARLEDYDAERELREQIAEMQEGGRNRRARQAEAGRESRFNRAQETKKKGSKPSFKIPPPPPEFR